MRPSRPGQPRGELPTTLIVKLAVEVTRWVAMADDLFPATCPIIGSVALRPLPGSPRYGSDWEAVVERALEDARTLEAGGVDGLSIENMGDAPFFKSEVPPETVAAMARVLSDLRRQTTLPLGVNVLRNAGRAALSLAQAFGAQFIRVNVLTEAHAA